jgi:hypothetical protein
MLFHDFMKLVEVREDFYQTAAVGGLKPKKHI